MHFRLMIALLLVVSNTVHSTELQIGEVVLPHPGGLAVFHGTEGLESMLEH